jgi:hypothetical protein
VRAYPILIDRAAFLDFEWSFFSPVLCLRATSRRENYRSKSECNWKKRG